MKFPQTRDNGGWQSLKGEAGLLLNGLSLPCPPCHLCPSPSLLPISLEERRDGDEGRKREGDEGRKESGDETETRGAPLRVPLVSSTKQAASMSRALPSFRAVVSGPSSLLLMPLITNRDPRTRDPSTRLSTSTRALLTSFPRFPTYGHSISVNK